VGIGSKILALIAITLISQAFPFVVSVGKH
jgi:hypothetical protein